MSSQEAEFAATPKKQLAAILFADIVDYTALMQRDEVVASRVLRLFRQTLEELVSENQGRIVNFYGDGCLCIFPTPAEAIHCASLVQQSFRHHHDIPVRIGLHSGTVVAEGDKYFGDSINIAARIESIGVPGSVLLSKKIRDEVKSNPNHRSSSLGTFQFKNIDEPMEVFALDHPGLLMPDARKLRGKGKRVDPTRMYRVLAVAAAVIALLLFAAMKWYDTGTSSTTKLAILPFGNQDTTARYEAFVKGIYQDIHQKLSGVTNLKLIPQASLVRYEETARNLSVIAADINVRYLAEGNVRRTSDSLHVDLQLFDAEEDQQIWSASYSGSMDQVFEMQATMAGQIVEILDKPLSKVDQTQLQHFMTTVPEAYDQFVKARTILQASWVPYPKLKQAIGFLEKAVEQDEVFAEGWALLSLANSRLYAMESSYDGREASADSIANLALQSLAKAKSLAPDNGTTYQADGYFQHIVEQDVVLALRSFDQSLMLNPDDVETLMYQAEIYFYLGELEKAIVNMEKAYHLDNDNPRVNYYLKTAYDYAGKFDQIPALLRHLQSLEPERTHLEVEARYFQFLADGSMKSWEYFESGLQTVRKTEQCNVRVLEDKAMVLAMAKGDFLDYLKHWSGMWDYHHASHGNWSCPLILNDESNQARLLFQFGAHQLAHKMVATIKTSSRRPINENSICVFDPTVLDPKLTLLSGDTALARQQFESILPKVLRNKLIPLGITERTVLLQTADLVVPERVYDIYREIVDHTLNDIHLAKICADPFTYPNLLRDPRFQEEIREDGRFVDFLSHHELWEKPLFSSATDITGIPLEQFFTFEAD